MMPHKTMMSISMVSANRDKTFIDTWAWVALADKNDSDHARARIVNQQLLDQERLFVTTNLVFGETVTTLRYAVSHAAAVKIRQMMNELVEGGLLSLIRVTEAHEEEAWRIFEKYGDQDFSWVDCTSFAVMKDSGFNDAFTKDHHFRIMGFITHC